MAPAIRTSSASPSARVRAIEGRLELTGLRPLRVASSSPACGLKGRLELTGLRPLRVASSSPANGPVGCSELPRAHRVGALRGAASRYPELTGVPAPEGWLRALRRAGIEDGFELTACPARRAALRSPLWLWEAEAGASVSTTEHVFAIRLGPSYICES